MVLARRDLEVSRGTIYFSFCLSCAVLCCVVLFCFVLFLLFHHLHEKDWELLPYML